MSRHVQVSHLLMSFLVL